MEFNIYLFFRQYVIFFIPHTLINVNAMIGHNIKQAKEGEYPYIASIMKIESGNPHSGGRYFCSGVLITRQDVLTAEHCLEEHAVNVVQILFDTIDIKNGTILHPVWWQTHDQWAAANDQKINFDINDLANMRLNEEASSHLYPIKLSSLSNSKLSGADVITAGWGRNNEGNRSEIMEVANLQVLTNFECSRRIEKLSAQKTPVDKKVLCTVAKPYILLDFGNSGGPLIFRNRLIAINIATSPAMPNRRPHKKQVNIHLATYYFKEFINYMKTLL